jgi:DNA repair exonuclease SbcCD ATPase subunit
LHYLLLIVERDALRQKHETLDKIEAEIEGLAGQMEELSAWADFPADLRDDVIRLGAERSRLQQECTVVEPQAVEARTKLGELNKQIAATETRVQRLEDAAGVPVGELASLREAVHQLELLRAQHDATVEHLRQNRAALSELKQRATQERRFLAPLLQLGYAGLARLEQNLGDCVQKEQQTAQTLRQAQVRWAAVGMSEEELARLEQQVRQFEAGAGSPEPRKGCRPFTSSRASARQEPPEIKAYYQIAPIHEYFVQARSELQRAKTLRQDAETQVAERLGQFCEETPDREVFHRAEKRLEEYQRSVAEVGQAEEALATAQAAAQQIREEYEPAKGSLKQRLQGLGLNHSSPRKALEAFEKRCEKCAQFEREQAALREMQARSEGLSQTINASAEKAGALRETETSLCEMLLAAQIECTLDTISDGLAQFEESASRHSQWNTAYAAYQAAISRRDAVLSEQSSDDLRAAINAAEQQVATQLSEHPEWSKLSADKSRQGYESELTRVERTWLSQRDCCNQLRDVVQSRDLQHLAMIDEEIAAQRATVVQLQGFRDALDLAQTELEAAKQEFQRQFAPRVEHLMGAGLAQTTQGRYSTVRVDSSDLGVSLIAPELGESVHADQLSTGTRDLVYLMLRVAIARLMSRTGERLPLLLDDPLVQCDRERLEQTLTFLGHLAEETQVLLFTKDEFSKAWFEDHLESQPCHRLHVLS